MAETWWTADTHFWHGAVLGYCDRPYSSVEEMNECLIENWNSVVKPKDDVWHLGDVAFCSQQKLRDILKRLNGNIHLVMGNHDKPARQCMDMFANAQHLSKNKYVYNIQEIRMPDEDAVKWGGMQKVVMAHFPLTTFNQMHYGSFHVHGHMHSKDNKYSYGRAIWDVGVDGNNYTPINYEQLKENIEGNLAKDRWFPNMEEDYEG